MTIPLSLYSPQFYLVFIFNLFSFFLYSFTLKSIFFVKTLLFSSFCMIMTLFLFSTILNNTQNMLLCLLASILRRFYFFKFLYQLKKTLLKVTSEVVISKSNNLRFKKAWRKLEKWIKLIQVPSVSESSLLFLTSFSKITPKFAVVALGLISRKTEI